MPDPSESAVVYLAQLTAEVRRRLFDESIPRIRKCLSLLNEEEIWRRPNAHLVSVGNLVLHLCGNARQWICSGLGGQADHRNRDAEFDTPGPFPVQFLYDELAAMQRDVEATLSALQPGTLTQHVRIQGFDETGLSVLVHVVEHFSYHTGQITWYTKWLKNLDTGYYAGMDLNV